VDPRIYRTGLVAVALAVVVVAFSLVDQQGPLASNLAPDAFSAQNALGLMNSLARRHPNRRPGSAGDAAVASFVAGRLAQYGFRVTTTSFRGRTAQGTRTLQSVTGARTGLSPGTIVVVSHRDSLRSPGIVDLSGTATMLELARVLAGETQHRTVVLASTSGSAGTAGAAELARTLPGPIDAVIALGDLASSRIRPGPPGPILVPWSTTQDIAPPLLRGTVAAALSSQAGLRPGGAGLAEQLEHLAFPSTLGEQAPFGARGIPAVSLSLAGDHPAPAQGATSSVRLGAMGRTVLQSVSALDAGYEVPSGAPYLLFSGKVVPAWAIRLLVLALLVPVLLAGLDGFARARRRGHAVAAGMARALTTALPFLAVGLLAVGARLVGVLPAAPPGPVAPGAVPLRGGGIALVVGLAIVLVGGLVLALGMPRRPRTGARPPDPGRAIGTMTVAGLAGLALWVLNPFAAVVVVPALHLWLWLLDPEVRPHPAVSVTLLLAGLAAPVLLAVDYARTLGLDPAGALWNGLLLLAGGQVGISTMAAWSVLLGCLMGVVAAALGKLRGPRPESAPVTVRGPVTYAGPGSLGGTKSALRR